MSWLRLSMPFFHDMVLTACRSAELPCDTTTPCEGEAPEEPEVGTALLELEWCFELELKVDEGADFDEFEVEDT